MVKSRLDKPAIEKVTVMVPFEIDAEFVSDVCCTAFATGCNYWCVDVLVDNFYGTHYASDAITKGAVLTLVDEDDDKHELTYHKFIRGYETYIGWCVSHKHTVYTDAGDIDAEIADMIMQFAIFGEIIYG